MLFTSFSFVLFAALTMLLYFTVPKRGQWGVLLVASLAFYTLSGEGYIIFILYTAAVTFITAHILQWKADREDAFVEANRETMEKSERKAYRAKEKKKRFRVLLVGLLLGFGMLAVLKYTAFVMESVRSVVTAFGGGSFSIPSLLLPLGISFYTFQSMGYLIDGIAIPFPLTASVIVLMPESTKPVYLSTASIPNPRTRPPMRTRNRFFFACARYAFRSDFSSVSRFFATKSSSASAMRCMRRAVR